MSQVIPNSFTSYLLTEEEEKQGAMLTFAQKQFIQNQKALVAEQKLALEFTPNDIHSYTQQESFLSGQLRILDWLLDASAAVEADMADRLGHND